MKFFYGRGTTAGYNKSVVFAFFHAITTTLNQDNTEKNSLQQLIFPKNQKK